MWKTTNSVTKKGHLKLEEHKKGEKVGFVKHLKANIYNNSNSSHIKSAARRKQNVNFKKRLT